jgi:putative membrane protein
MGGWSMALWGLSSVAIWGLLVVGVVALLWYGTGSGGSAQASPPASAQELLAQRYARGEIDEDEYTRRLRVLQGGGTTSRAGG